MDAQERKLTPKKSYQGSGDWIEPFVAALRNSGNVRFACQQAGVSRTIAYNRKEADSAFAAQWKEAMDDAVDHLEAVAWQRAKESENVLLIFLLKAHRPEMYRENVRLEHSGIDGGPIAHKAEPGMDPSKLTTEELVLLDSLLAKATVSETGAG